MSRLGRPLLPLVLLAALAPACTLTFEAGTAQALRLLFELTAVLPEGEPTTVHALFHPEQVKLRKRFLRVAGKLDTEGRALPERLVLVAETADLESGRRLQTLRMTLDVAADGSFEAVTRVRKNLAAGSFTTVTLEPLGESLARGTGVRLCIDLVKRKADLASRPCVDTGGGPPPPQPAPTTFSAIQEQIFTPSCAKGGCHSAASASAGLILAAGQAYAQLVNVPSNQVPFRLRVEPGDPDNSYLIQKLEQAMPAAGVQMPLGQAPLDPAVIAEIRQWIADGALR